MDTPALHLLEDILKADLLPSWHLEARRDLGIPDECREGTMLCLTLVRQGVQIPAVAFILDADHLHDIELALHTFLNEAFDPVTGRADAVAVIDYLPPIDEMGSVRGSARRWAMDDTNREDILPEIIGFLRVVAL